jgi:hypothetical protein
MGERKIEIYMAFDNRENELWFVDSAEKLSRLMRTLSLKRPMTIDHLKATVYDCERLHRQDCVVDVEGWLYTSRRARGLEKGLFAQQLFVSESPANQ